jgi:hypothetical protein
LPESLKETKTSYFMLQKALSCRIGVATVTSTPSIAQTAYDGDDCPILAALLDLTLSDMSLSLPPIAQAPASRLR